MNSKLSITFPANAGVVGAPTSGVMHIEPHSSRIKNETSLMAFRIIRCRQIVSLAIKRLGVTNCNRTFLCSRQVHKPPVGACNTVFSVNKFCKKRRHY